jgi:hypothetical protein
MPSRDRRVDAYIRNAAPFARPILTRLRKVVHAACPEVVEGFKWSFPHFDYKGIFCSMAAFKGHCTFGFWKYQLLEKVLPKVDEQAMGQFGRMTSIADLPDNRTLVRIIKAAAKLNDDGVKVPRAKSAPKPPVKPPAHFMTAIGRNKKALATFRNFSPSNKREYVEWVAEAKTDETRNRRLATAVEWMAAGKSRNWKYERAT